MTDDPEGARRLASERIAEVRARFVAGLAERTAALAALAHAAGGADRAEASRAFDAVRLGLHNLAGGAPTLGLSSLGKDAAGLERRLIAARLPDGGVDEEIAAAIAEAVGRLPGAQARA